MLRCTIRKLPTPAGGSFISGHMDLFTPLAKHKFEEKNSKALGPIYRQRYYTRQTVVIADPALAQEVCILCPSQQNAQICSPKSFPKPSPQHRDHQVGWGRAAYLSSTYRLSPT